MTALQRAAEAYQRDWDLGVAASRQEAEATPDPVDMLAKKVIISDEDATKYYKVTAVMAALIHHFDPDICHNKLFTMLKETLDDYKVTGIPQPIDAMLAEMDVEHFLGINLRYRDDEHQVADEQHALAHITPAHQRAPAPAASGPSHFSSPADIQAARDPMASRTPGGRNRVVTSTAANTGSSSTKRKAGEQLPTTSTKKHNMGDMFKPRN